MAKEAGRPWVKLAACAGMAACAGDLLMPWVVGHWYPGYQVLRDTQSTLGMANSPVARWAQGWWALFGALLLIFAAALPAGFPARRRAAAWAALSLVFFALGEGLGTSIFPADVPGGAVTAAGLLHTALSVLGEAGLMLFPLLMARAWPATRRHARATFLLAVLAAALFGMARTLVPPESTMAHFKGLFQGLLLLALYLYLFRTAFQLFRAPPTPGRAG